MTYRERRLAKADRLREWAELRRKKAGPTMKLVEHFRDDHALFSADGDLWAHQAMASIKSYLKTNITNAGVSVIG